ncbi:MAG: hypothetical protein LBH80_00255 [Prevotellaceae bacterium]|nr:hypothetical protein [Prevotellaceae bacterium]
MKAKVMIVCRFQSRFVIFRFFDFSISVPAFSVNKLFGKRIAETTSQTFTRYSRIGLFCSGLKTPCEVIKAINPPSQIAYTFYEKAPDFILCVKE